jgi:predicted aspartyl protease
MNKLMSRLSMLAALAAAGACLPAPVQAADACTLARDGMAQAALRMPFELVDGRIYVQAQVNQGGPYRFAVDTGASGMGRADARLVAALGLRESGQVANSDGVRTEQSGTVRLDALALGGLVRRDVGVISRDYAARLPPARRFDGILGREFFGDGLLVIDYPNRRLAFTTAAGITADAAGSLGYERPFRVPVTIGGVPATGHLDTGANVSAVVPEALYRRLDATPAQAAAPGRLTNGSIATRRATLAGPVEIGGVRLSNLEVRVSEKFPELLIGAHLLQGQLLAIDQRTRRVALCPPAAD